VNVACIEPVLKVQLCEGDFFLPPSSSFLQLEPVQPGLCVRSPKETSRCPVRQSFSGGGSLGDGWALATTLAAPLRLPVRDSFMRRRMGSIRAIQGDSGRFRAIQAYSSQKKLFNPLIVNPPTLSAPRFGRITIF
jgi:hypothetical protein